MYNRIYNLLVEGITTGGDPYKTGKRVGTYLLKNKDIDKKDQIKRIRFKIKKRGKNNIKQFNNGFTNSHKHRRPSRSKRRIGNIPTHSSPSNRHNNLSSNNSDRPNYFGDNEDYD